MRLLALCSALLVAPCAIAQQASTLAPLDLVSMDAFQPTGTNWSLASQVSSDRHERGSLAATPGTGILVNQPAQQARQNLFTAWQHGDLELELEFLMPKESNSGIYLQGRYEVQLLDSWGKARPGFGDVGGIYQRWNESERVGFEGHPPRANAARAPGLWQSLRVVFRAPHFDATGRKIRHARFELVMLNGSVLHQNVEVTGPTRAAAFDDEAARGPLMIQGDHGPVAFRSIRYKKYLPTPIDTRAVEYRLFTGEGSEVPTMPTPTGEGRLAHLRGHVIEDTNPVRVDYTGLIHLPATGMHHISVALDWVTGDPHFRDNRIGGAALSIAGTEVLRHDTNATVVERSMVLQAGDQPFAFSFHKLTGWRTPGVTLRITGPRSPAHTLMQAPRRGQPASPIPVAVNAEPVILRGFVEHGATKRTHAVSVGDPSGVHYSMDLSTAALLHVWRGDFLDATAMWHNRGHDQLAKPKGSALSLPGHPPIVSPRSADSVQSLGYRIDESGRPLFRYALGTVAIEDVLAPAEQGPYLWRTLTFSADGEPPDGLWVRAAEGTTITMVQEGAYAVGDRAYYIELFGGAEVRAAEGGQTLMLPVRFTDGASTVSYAVIW